MKKKMVVLNYKVIVEPDERVGTGELCYYAYCPKLDIADDGDTINDALANIKEAIELKLEFMADMGEEVPMERDDVMFTSVSIPTSREFNFV